MRLHPSHGRASLALVTTALVLILAACSSGSSSTSTTTTTTPTTSDPLLRQIAALPGYTVGLFAKGTSAYNNPDSVEVDGSHVFITYQNNSVKDGSDNSKMSTIVEYNRDGSLVKVVASVPGHSDGVRVDPSTHLLWVTSNEDASPLLMTVDPASGTVTNYTLAPTVHGGGYDDLAFVNGKVFIACSNPNTNAAGVNIYPAVDEVTLQGTNAVVTPVLMGDATATDTIAKTTVNINAIDPDSLTVDWQGNLVLVDQAGNEIITIQNPGTPTQSVSRITVGDQLDDTIWATTGQGEFLVVDATLNATFTLRTNFVVGSLNKWIYTAVPNDSGTASFVGTLDPSTGFVTPVMIGLGKPTGLYFLPDHS